MTPELRWLSDPTVFAVNRLDAHSDHLCCRTLDEAESGLTSLRQSLDGAWRFAWSANPAARPADFWQPDADLSSFGTIRVPGHIELQGYGQLQYTNTLYPWDGRSCLRPPQVDWNDDPVGSYVKEFDLDESLRGQRVCVSFQGVEQAMYLWCNGQFVGYAEDSFTPSEFDLTPYIRDENNRLCVEVYKRSSAAWIEDQDFFRFSGIFRSVYLYAKPRVHINDIWLKADLAADNTTGLLTPLVKLDGETDGASAALVVTDPEGYAVYEGPAAGDTIEIEGIQPWSHAAPVLYHAVLTLRDADGVLQEVVPYDIGFRRFEMINGVMCLNGERVVFNGVNRHEWNADRGRAIGADDMHAAMAVFKKNNINAVRTCHYPDQSLWYDLCDRNGIYMIDETNLESHGSWQKLGAVEPSWNVPGSLPEWKDCVVDRARSMFERDKNHAAVLIWSCGNESYAGEDILAMSQFFHDHDPGRLVHYEGVFHCRAFDAISDMESRMYAKPWEIREYLESHPKKPFILCEYMHDMGNSLGGMESYVKLADEFDQYQGGFIWDFIDQAIYATQPDGTRSLRYGGDFGDRPSDYEFSGDGLLFADRKPSPKAQEVKQLYSNVHIDVTKDSVSVKNDNLFTATGDYVFVLSVLADGKPVWQSTRRFDVPAGETRTFDVAWPVAAYRADARELVLQVSQRLAKATDWAESGYELAFGQAVVPADAIATPDTKPADGTITVGRWNAGVRGAGREVLLSRTQGGMVSYTFAGNEFVLRRPAITTFRPLTDNDRGAGHGFERVQWLGAGRYARCVDNVLEQIDDSTLKGTYTYELATAQRTKVTVSYTAHTDGRVNLHVEYPGEQGDLPTIPAFGIEWTLPVQYTNLRFFGTGPEETYLDRKHAKLGVWSTNAFADHAPYLMPQETGNHEDVRWAEITDDHGHGMRVSRADGAAPFAVSLLPYSSFMLEEAQHQDELPKPKHMFLRVLAAQMGVGGDDSWMSPVHPQYHIPADKPISLDVDLELI